MEILCLQSGPEKCEIIELGLFDPTLRSIWFSILCFKEENDALLCIALCV